MSFPSAVSVGPGIGGMMPGGSGPAGEAAPDRTVPVAPWQSRRLREDHRGEGPSRLTARFGSVALSVYIAGPGVTSRR